MDREIRSSIPRRRHVKLPLSKMKWNLVLDKQNRALWTKTRSHFGQGSESARSRLFIPLFMKLGSDWKSAMEIVIFSKRKLARGRCLKCRGSSRSLFFLDREFWTVRVCREEYVVENIRISEKMRHAVLSKIPLSKTRDPRAIISLLCCISFASC